MSLQPNEDCPVCWRSFSLQLIPFSIPCGHSLCPDCSTDLPRCPLCRKRLIPGYTRVRNFSLLSLLERITMVQKTDSRDQQVQTEYTVIAKKAKKAPLSLEATAADILTRPLNLKFHKDPLGNIKSLAIRFK
jgi:hypothetical protein